MFYPQKIKITLTPARRATIQKLLTQLDSFGSLEKPLDGISTKFQANYLKNVRDNRLATSKTEDDGSNSPSPPPPDEQLTELSGLLFNINEIQDLDIQESLRGPIPMERFRKVRLDETLWEELQLRQDTNRDKEMMKFRETLPTYQVRDEIMDLIVENQVRFEQIKPFLMSESSIVDLIADLDKFLQVVVIEGETGSGKTTQIPSYILDRWISDLNGSICNVVCTQPRRISAISVAERVAQERSEVVGGKSIGYSIRLENKLPTGRSGGTIIFCTTGILLQHLRSDPYLNRVSHLVIDEVHERDILNDFLLAMVKDLMVARPDLKVILMSATINANQFSSYFNNCPIYHIPGFTHPVEELYLEDVLERTGFRYFSRRDSGWEGGRQDRAAGFLRKREFDSVIVPYVRKLEKTRQYSRKTLEQLKHPESEEVNVDLILTLIQDICKREADAPEKSILVFLPGWSEISKLHRLMTESYQFPEEMYQINPVHSLMPTINQREVFNRPPAGVRKIVLATNIAETSITIDDIYYVIGKSKSN